MFGSWNTSEKRFKRPRGLKGRDIGMYYKALNMNRKKDLPKENIINLTIPPTVLRQLFMNLKSIANVAQLNNINLPNLKTAKLHFSKQMNDRKEKETISFECSNLNPPSEKPLEKELFVLKTKYNLGEPSDMSLKIKAEDAHVIKEYPTDRGVAIETKVICDNKEPKDNYCTNIFEPSNVKVEPGMSSTPDFIAISATKPEYDINDRQLSLRFAGDYKYGYDDIITGTFEEKLEECLSKGISINKLNDDLKQLNDTLYEEYINMCSNPQYKRMFIFREKLPTYKKANELLNIINNNQVIVISGETGCGKSTQVPQLILDNAISEHKGANVKILVTQPRRIAASSLAKRVAQERGEELGNSVGFAVRLEKVDSRPRGSIMFVTTGILLADVEINQSLTEYSHIILDEVHERDTHIDLSMCILKMILKKRKDLKLILMSATIDSDRLSSYFDDCPMVHIEGLAYPVKDYYLEDILDFTKYKLIEPPGRNTSNSRRWRGKERKRRMKAEADRIEGNVKYRSEISAWLESKKKNMTSRVYENLLNPKIEDLNIDLIFELIIFICKGEPGAILVFLPGIGDITKLLRKFEASGVFPESRYNIYPLHSKLSTLEQHKIFERPPEFIRKIIVATNIAETSITIDDVVYVIDCGKLKLSGLNVAENISTLKTENISKANLMQRRGRAGRCQEGICYHMLTSYRAEKLEERILPELQRSNLLEPVLAIKRLRLGKASEALLNVPDSPATSTIDWAVKHLQQCGALDDSERLTPLGWHLARLPVHPAAGKLVLLGALFGCLDRAASVAAVWGFKDPFLLVIGKEDEVKKSKRSFSLNEPSDHVAVAEALIQWEYMQSSQGRKAFAYDNYLSNSTLMLLSDMKAQLGDSLKHMGFLPSGNTRSSWENRNSYNLSLFKAIVAASLYPNVATVRWLGINKYGLVRRAVRIKAYTPEEGVLTIHPSSVMAMGVRDRAGHTCNYGANWLVYWLKQRSSELFLIDVTLVYTLPLLFFGELIVSDGDEHAPDSCYISINSVKVRCEKQTADILIELRSLLDLVLASKIMDSSDYPVRHNEFEELVLNAVTQLITAEDEKVNYLQDDDDQSQESDVSEQDSGVRNKRRFK